MKAFLSFFDFCLFFKKAFLFFLKKKLPFFKKTFLLFLCFCLFLKKAFP